MGTGVSSWAPNPQSLRRPACLHACLPALPCPTLPPGPPTFSLISSARLHSGSASLYLPRLPYRTARLFNVAAT